MYAKTSEIYYHNKRLYLPFREQQTFCRTFSKLYQEERLPQTTTSGKRQKGAGLRDTDCTVKECVCVSPYRCSIALDSNVNKLRCFGGYKISGYKMSRK